MITYAEIELALKSMGEKIDIPSTMTKGKHLKGEIHLLSICSLLLVAVVPRHHQTETESSSITKFHAFIVTSTKKCS